MRRAACGLADGLACGVGVQGGGESGRVGEWVGGDSNSRTFKASVRLERVWNLELGKDSKALLRTRGLLALSFI